MIHDNGAGQETEAQPDSLRVGVVDWEQPALLEQFYPDDLPADWRLGFYANAFTAVLVPRQHWMNLSTDERDEWQDLPEVFHLYLEAQSPQDDESLSALQALLPGQFVQPVSSLEPGVYPQQGIAIINWPDRSMREWRYWLEQHGTNIHALFLGGGAVTIGQLEQCRDLVELLGL